MLALLLVAAAIASAALIPFLLPYLHAQRDQGLIRSLQAVAVYQGSWRDYLTTGSRLHYDAWSVRFWVGMRAALFPGVVATLLAGVALVTGHAWRDRAQRLWLAVGLAGLLLSFGTRTPGYVWLYYLVPLLQGIRAPVRFGYLVLVAVAALAGFGLAWLNRQEWLSNSRRRMAVGVLISVLVTAEAARFPIGWVPRYQVPAIYKMLALEQSAGCCRTAAAAAGVVRTERAVHAELDGGLVADCQRLQRVLSGQLLAPARGPGALPRRGSHRGAP